MNAVIVALRLLALLCVIHVLIVHTAPGRAFTNLLAVLIGGTDTEGNDHA